MNVLIVDDEPRHRKSLGELIHKLKGYDILESKNGIEALDIIRAQKVDCLITDIQMPYTSGLELLKAISEEGYSIPAVVISAYSQFEYAQEAIRYGVVDYLVKPVNSEKITQALAKVEQIVEKNRQSSQRYSSIESRLNKTIDIYMNSQMCKLIRHSLSDAELAEMRELIPHEQYFFMVTFSFAEASNAKIRLSSDEINELILNLKYWIKDALREMGHCLTFMDNEVSQLICTVCASDMPFTMGAQEINSLFQQFTDKITTNYFIDLAIGYSGLHEHLFENASTAYEEALLAHDLHFYFGYNLPLAYNPKKMSSEPMNISKHIDIKGIAACITSNNIEKSVEMIKAMFSKSIFPTLPRPQEFRSELTNVFITICNITLLPFKETEYSVLANRIRMQLGGAKTYNDAYRISQELINEISSVLSGTKSSKNEAIIKLAQDYICTHYSEPITLETCAEALYFNSNYFCMFFKKNLGVNFSDYLQNFRVEKAKGLLVTTNDKVYEIASSCGFRNVKYFNRIFKKHVNMTPEEYRKFAGRAN